MRRHSETEITRPGCASEFADHVAMRPHLRGIPGSHVGAVHRKAVTVFCDRNDIPGSRPGKEIDPGCRIEVLRLKHGNKIFVPEFFQRAVGGDLMLVGGVGRNVHVAGVPLAPECRNGIHTPVKKDSELCVLKPGWGSICGE